MDNHHDHTGSGSDTPNDSKRPSKLATILRLFIQGHNLNRFEAEGHHDHCLHSTVSSLEDRGVRIARHWETVPCLGGKKTVRCMRYWLDTTMDNPSYARSLLSTLERRVT